MKFAIPSREDAWDMTRNEKTSMMFLSHAVSTLVEARTYMKDRLERIDGGVEKLDRLANESLELLNEIRRTIPERQRISLVNTGKDYEIRLAPKLTPNSTNVVVTKEEFRTLVNSAQARCKECAEDNESCRKCDLFQLLTVVLPMDDYKWHNLCPYVAEWEN